MDENKIIPYIEPIFCFCCKRLSDRYDAEDLASEIICHILDGMNKYRIESLDAWVWRIAHNRYARFIDNRNKSKVEETVDESENCAEYNSGCNVAGDDSGSEYKIPLHIYYYWVSKYFDYSVYHNKGMRRMCANGIPQNSVNGIVSKEALSEKDAAHLIKTNLLIKSETGFRLNFPHFTAEQFVKFVQ